MRAVSAPILSLPRSRTPPRATLSFVQRIRPFKCSLDRFRNQVCGSCRRWSRTILRQLHSCPRFLSKITWFPDFSRNFVQLLQTPALSAPERPIDVSENSYNTFFQVVLVTVYLSLTFSTINLARVQNRPHKRPGDPARLHSSEVASAIIMLFVLINQLRPTESLVIPRT